MRRRLDEREIRMAYSGGNQFGEPHRNRQIERSLQPVHSGGDRVTVGKIRHLGDALDDISALLVAQPFKHHARSIDVESQHGRDALPRIDLAELVQEAGREVQHHRFAVGDEPLDRIDQGVFLSRRRDASSFKHRRWDHDPDHRLSTPRRWPIALRHDPLLDLIS